MIGALIGDYCGSRWEKKTPPTTKEFDLDHSFCSFTDDTVLTFAVADAVISETSFEQKYKEYYEKYPNAGYGRSFKDWTKDTSLVNNSYGNGSAMRVSPLAYVANNEKELSDLVEKSIEKTHAHYESYEGANAIALSLLLIRQGLEKEDVMKVVQSKFSLAYSDLKNAIKPNRPNFSSSCVITVPQALSAFFNGNNITDILKNSIMIGGDVDTIASMSGVLAFEYYKKERPEKLIKILNKLPQEMKLILNKFNDRYMKENFISDLIKNSENEENKLKHPFVEI